MTLKEIVDCSLKEESDPEQVARKINSKISELKQFSNTDLNGIIILLTNEISKNGIPIGNEKFINPNNEKELDNYINKIYSNIIINDNYTNEVIQNVLQTLKQRIKNKFNNLL